jgi:tRNA(Arg) A34 adenosine deaminase TadA
MASSDQHRKRMKALVAFTASSFDTEFPSPFGSAIYDERSGVLVAQAYDTVMQMCDPTNHAEINAIRDAARELQRLSRHDHVTDMTGTAGAVALPGLPSIAHRAGTPSR